ncbi:late secretory pathway protein avl9 [Rhizoclosmatium sp. JEL0117]|nr:late secretory pathway protein avl9 [Rhizoclosmatium sp. JEL0117]
MTANPPPTILRVLVASFHHKNGNQIDYAVPAFAAPESPVASSAGVPLPAELAVLPFLCIPDGAHAIAASNAALDEDGPVDPADGEDFVYFTIPITGGRPIYGISCFRQIAASDLLVKPSDVTRTMVQKAVVVLTSEPLFGPLVQKLSLVTKSYFEQRDFTQLAELYANLNTQFQSSPSDLTLHTGLNLRETVTTFKGSLLQIVKLILLERRILFFGTNTSRLGQTQYGILSLIPGLLRSLCANVQPGDATASTEETLSILQGFKTEILGFPLKVFNENTWFLPFISLHQIDLMTSPDIQGWMFGTSNSIFAMQRGAHIDAIVNTDTGAVEIINGDLQGALGMTAADRAFIEEIVDTVVDSWEDYNENDLNDEMGDYEGSDNYIRNNFESYFTSLAVTAKHALVMDNEEDAAALALDDEFGLEAEMIDKDLLADFNYAWIDLWYQTKNYQLWRENPLLNPGDLLKSPGHLKHGTPTTDPVAAALQNIKNTFTPIGTGLTRALNQAEARVSTVVRDLTSAEQQKALSEQFEKAKEVATDLSKKTGEVLSSAGKAAEIAALNAGKAAQEGFGAVVAGFKDPNVMQENANKVFENVGAGARKIWSSWGSWFDPLAELQKEQEREEREARRASQVKPQQQTQMDPDVGGHDLEGEEPFVLGEAGQSTQNLKFHEDSPVQSPAKPEKKGKKEEEDAEEVGYSFI